MPREVVIRTACGISAAHFWSLRSDTGFDDWFCKLDKQTFHLEKNDKTVSEEGVSMIDRAFRMYMQEDQVPKAFKTMLPKDSASKFFVKVVCSFSPHHFDEAHPYQYRAIYPVFTERIHVQGKQWVEPVSTTSCWLHARISVRVDLAIVGGTIERWIEGLIRQAYDDLPARCAAPQPPCPLPRRRAPAVFFPPAAARV